MSRLELEKVKEGLVEAGVEVYRVVDSVIEIAERVRLHIMDSGIRVDISDTAEIVFTVRSQRSDFPAVNPGDLFDKVRGHVGEEAQARGYAESGAATRNVTDPLDDSRVLDVFHEITYARAAGEVSEIVDEVQWALTVDKYVAP